MFARAWAFFLCALCVSAVQSPGARGQEPESRPAVEQKEDELSKRLIRQAVSGSEGDVMAQVIRLMSEAQDRLAAKLDPGADTQVLQQRIIDRLDDAIKTAMQQRRRGSPSPSPSEAERRKMPEEQGQAQGREEKQPGGASGEAADSGKAPADSKAAEKLRGPLIESRRGWGHLPKRDRDELLQGIDEEVIERYRRQIDQYYRALGDQAPEEEP